MKLGIVGMPSSGKTSLFKAVTLAGEAEFEGKVRSGIHLRAVQVPDDRLVWLRELYKPKKYTPASVQYVDSAGHGAAGGVRDPGFDEALRDVDGFVQVLRAFDNPAAPHPKGRVDPIADAEDLRMEMVLRDLDSAERRLEKLAKPIQLGRATPQEKHEAEVLAKIKAVLDAGGAARDAELGEDDRKAVRAFAFLTARPMIHVLNVGEDAREAFPEADAAFPGLLRICASLEAELASVPAEERATLAEGMGVTELAAFRLIRRSYEALGLASFFTVGEDEVRAWTFSKGESALECAGHIHTDLARGFIRAEVAAYEDLKAAGSLPECRNRGTLRLEGKAYPVADGEIVHIRFSV